MQTLTSHSFSTSGHETFPILVVHPTLNVFTNISQESYKIKEGQYGNTVRNALFGNWTKRHHFGVLEAKMAPNSL